MSMQKHIDLRGLRILSLSILEQTKLDLQYIDGTRKKEHEEILGRRTARAFANTNNSWFNTICEAAKVDPDFVIECWQEEGIVPDERN